MSSEVKELKSWWVGGWEVVLGVGNGLKDLSVHSDTCIRRLVNVKVSPKSDLL